MKTKNIPKGFREVLSQQNRLTEFLVEQQQQTLLPTLTISKFTGNPLDFFTFVRTFESQIESKLKSNDVRLRYLERYVEGEPRELIKGCLHLDGQNGYTEAMKLLVEKYGDPYQISNAYIKKIEDWPYVKQGDDQALDRFATFLTQCRSAMSELRFLSTLDHPHNIQTMVKKLPLSLQDRWRREASKLRATRNTTRTFANVVEFVKTEAGIAMDPVYSREALNRHDISDRPGRFNKGENVHKPKIGDRSRATSHVSSHATAITATPEAKGLGLANSCKMCGKTHDLDDCKEYLKKTLQERREFLKDKDLCFACCQAGHRSNGCAQRKTCKTCSRRHPTGLHDDNFRLNQVATKKQNPSSEQSTDVLTATHVETEEAFCSAVGTGLKAAGKEVLTYAMLDSCSTGTFLLEDIAACLDAKGTDTKLMVKTVNGTQLHDAKALNGLIVTDLNGENRIDLPKTFTKEDISAIEVNVPAPELARKWKHLKRIADCMPSQLHGAKVGLLIGSNCPKALEPIDIVASENGGPYAINTFVGWAIVGPLNLSKKDHQTVNCNRIAVVEVGSEKPLDHHFAVEDKVKEIVTPQALIRMRMMYYSRK